MLRLVHTLLMEDLELLNFLLHLLQFLNKLVRGDGKSGLGRHLRYVIVF